MEELLPEVQQFVVASLHKRLSFYLWLNKVSFIRSFIRSLYVYRVQHKVKMGSTNFASLEALILHFGETNLPNKTTPLTKAHSQYVPRAVDASK